jgi:hypothetical protein
MVRKALQVGLLSVLAGIFLVALPVYAASVDDAQYIADIVVENTGGSTTNACTVCDINTDALIDDGYITSDLLNTAIQAPGGTDIAYMPGVGDDPWIILVPAIAASEQKSYLFYTGGPAMQDNLMYFPDTGGMTSDDAASLELGDNFEVEQKCYIDTSAGSDKYLVYKQDALQIWISDTSEISAQLNSTGTSAIKYEYYDSGDDSQVKIYGTSRWAAQTFTPSTGHIITKVILLLYRQGSPGTIDVSIEGTDGSGHPDGNVLCSGSTNGDTLPTSSPYEWREITLGDGADLSASTNYAIVIKATSGDNSNNVQWRTDSSSPTYSGGCQEFTTGGQGGWVSYTSNDLMFEEWGIETVQKTVTATGVSSGEHTVKVTADETNFKIFIDGVEKDSVALEGASVTDNDNDWSFLTNSSVLYMDYHKITVDDTLKQHIVYERDTTFQDQTAYNNDATPTFITESTDPDVSATVSNFRPIEENELTGYTTEETAEIMTETPDMPSEMYAEGETEHLPGAALVNRMLDVGGIPHDLFWIPLCFGIAAGSAVLTYRWVKSLLIISIIGGVAMLFFALTGVIPFWPFLIYAVLAGGILVAEKHLSW